MCHRKSRARRRQTNRRFWGSCVGIYLILNKSELKGIRVKEIFVHLKKLEVLLNLDADMILEH